MKCNKNNSHILVIVLLLIMLILSVLSFFKKDSARNLETIKVGGIENMEAVQELYKSDSYKAQQSAAIDQALSQIKIDEPTDTEINEDANVDENTEVKDVIIDEANVNNDMIKSIEELKASAVIHGDENARFTIIEYSELLCPYCKRQSDQGTIDSVLKKYPNEVNATFRNFIVHAPAAKLGEAIECAGELGSNDDYFKFVTNAFAHQGNLDVDAMVTVADNMGINKKDMQKCLDDGRYAAAVTSQTSEGRNLFGVSGTPGNVIVDKMTGKFVLIPGAYPAEKFIEEIEKMKAE